MNKSFVQKKKEINPRLKWRVVGPAANSSLHIFFANLYSVRLINGVPIFEGDHILFSCKFKEEGGGGQDSRTPSISVRVLA